MTPEYTKKLIQIKNELRELTTMKPSEAPSYQGWVMIVAKLNYLYGFIESLEE